MEERDNHFTHYLHRPRHWDPKSEKFTGVDSLLTAIQKGWKPQETVVKKEFYRGDSRPVSIYAVELHRNGEVVTMAVVGNPYLHKVLAQYHCTIVKHTAVQTPTPI